MTARRMRVPQQALADPNIAEVAAEDTFSSTRYQDALAQEIEISPTHEERIVWERQLDERLTIFSAGDKDPDTDTDSPPTLIFDPSRLFCRDVAQFAMLTNVC